MGPCSSNSVSCLFQDSFYSQIWWDKDLKLPALGGQTTSVTMSGYSGGSFMSANLHTIYSDTIKGVGLICGGPYSDNGRQFGVNRAIEAVSRA